MTVIQTAKALKPAWWKETTVYQIYPSSFQDSNGDGIGDLPGITSRLDYIKSIGVDAVWLSPCFDSPQVDMGYDISDYKNIYPAYGTIEDADELIKSVHERGLKILMDLVVNHTSDQHPWFKESRSSTDSLYRDWYIWRKPRYDSEGNRHSPNNWSAAFGGSAWTFDEATQEYYLHLFAVEQPDLNWENEKVRAAVHDIMKFWLERGADGFRMDVINFISKDQRFPDAEVKNINARYQDGSLYFACGPRLHEYLQEIGQILIEYDAFSVGEMPACNDPEEIIKAVNIDRKELNMIFNFELVDIDHGKGGKFTPGSWKLADVYKIINKWQTFMQENGGWNAIYLENHDQPRSVSRFANDSSEFRNISAKMVSTFLALQQGTLFVYQGQELGLRNVPITWNISKYRDLETLNHYNELEENNASSETLEATVFEYQKKSRDNARYPFPWDRSVNAGFSTSSPWIDINEDYVEWNAAEEDKDPDSVLNYWRRVLKIRKEWKDAFIYGKFEMVTNVEEERVLAFKRTNNDISALIVCNFSNDASPWTIPEEFENGKILLSNYNRSKITGVNVLKPYEAFSLLK
ncbi:uncharacterized protein AC631_05371 [Debaryomyces fabryi]|uniref:Glycosyl hydrolase family 13 catalytic domain-containing protein n=1 Tax=Debaryomyces fabryi TaxID=58627 RepID=A0A0V1PRL6_9ASCO|nr:uncharacterized protein AC631_05371 [Debaryomyces fabryi]KRZ98872.1 hypothetical protein AC631_05371 [Debaryomyces fabryi]CUM55866.1 unnamed protein product [Debaryomyces fabryi]